MIAPQDEERRDCKAIYDASGNAAILNDLITHEARAEEVPGAYRTAFEDPTCLKRTLNWREAE